ncbi:MAG: nucleoside triphosphate pyrophosphohydrolase [Cyanobacteria bacterium HKST-UBA06]|nr:nucleoside triphosphate pyrophosphohydrolase [Cyanobacteria bacterium HKST-UBA06]
MMVPVSRTQLRERLERLEGLDRLLAVVAALRDPDGGCPWDLKQTHASLRPYMLEEAYEAVEAMAGMAAGQSGHLEEELGDVLLQVALHAQLASEAGQFTFASLSQGIADKLIRRHPHVFAEDEAVKVEDAEAVTANWEAIKAREKLDQGEAAPKSLMDSVPNGLPALMRADKASRKAVKAGFKWPHFESLWSCVLSEYDELRHEIDHGGAPDKLEDELGDCLFATVSLAHFIDVNPEVALHRATHKFMTRYRAMETLIREQFPDCDLDGLDSLDFDTLDQLWRAAKQATQQACSTTESSPS